MEKAKIDNNYLLELESTLTRKEFNRDGKPITESLYTQFNDIDRKYNDILQKEKKLKAKIINLNSKEESIVLYDEWKILFGFIRYPPIY